MLWRDLCFRLLLVCVERKIRAIGRILLRAQALQACVNRRRTITFSGIREVVVANGPNGRFLNSLPNLLLDVIDSKEPPCHFFSNGLFGASIGGRGSTCD